MGAGASSFQNRQQQAFRAQERRKKRAIKREQDKVKRAESAARKSERDAWLRVQRLKTTESKSRVLAWLTWPLQWWKEKKAWEREEAKRARERNADHELSALTSGLPTERAQEAEALASGMASEGESGRLRKREVRSNDYT